MTPTVTVDVEISASPAQVWQAMTDPEAVREWFLGTQVDTTWEPGASITWSGEYDGQAYEDKGQLLEVVPEELLVHTHYSPLSGAPDEPESYRTVTWRLQDEGTRTRLTLDQTTLGEETSQAKETWEQVLGQLKEHVESGR
jgi:uncharacterized protein YndB with AHSA1/START domain